MFNHTKDIPFATAMMAASYFLLRATRDLPRPRLSDLAAFGLSLGFALGQRAIGLIALFYVLIAIMLHTPRPFGPASAAHFVGRSLILFVPALALAYLIMIAAWPWAAISLFNPVRGLFAFSHFQYPIKTLIGGHIYLMGQVPRWYVPLYLAIKLPLVLLSGAALAAGLAARLARGRDAPADVRRVREIAFMAITVVLPVLAQVVEHGPAFSGMRHFTFVVPPLAVLAGLGFDQAFRWMSARRFRYATSAFAAVLSVWFAWTASVLVRLHPYEYLYFNPIVGGLPGAAQRYDTDYWVNVMREAVKDLEAYLDREGRPLKTYSVAVCGESLPFRYEAAPRARLTLAKDDQPADFFISPTHMACDQALDGTVIVRIERMGVPIGVVKDRRSQTEMDVARRR
jgi:hypothetical protein